MPFLADVEIVELLEREVAHLGIAALDQLLGAGDLGDDGLVLAVLLHERLDLGERLGLLAVFVGITLHLRGAERRHQLFVLGLGRCNLVEQSDLNQCQISGLKLSTPLRTV